MLSDDPAGASTAKQGDESKDQGEEVGERRGDGNARHRKTERPHKQHVESHVHHARHQHIDHRPHAVPRGAEDGGNEAVKHGGGHAEEVDLHIEDRHVEHVLLAVHPDEELAGEDQRDHHQNDSGGEAEDHGGANGAAHALFIASADSAGDDDVGTRGEAVEEGDQEGDERAASAHSRHRRVSRHQGKHRHVGGVKEDRDQISDDQGEGEQNQRLKNGSFREILFHRSTSFFCFCREGDFLRSLRGRLPPFHQSCGEDVFRPAFPDHHYSKASYKKDRRKSLKYMDKNDFLRYNGAKGSQP